MSVLTTNTDKRFTGFLQPLEWFGAKPITLVETNHENYAFDNMHKRIAEWLAKYPKFVGQAAIYDRDAQPVDTWVFNAIVYLRDGNPVIVPIERWRVKAVAE